MNYANNFADVTLSILDEPTMRNEDGDELSQGCIELSAASDFQTAAQVACYWCLVLHAFLVSQTFPKNQWECIGNTEQFGLSVARAFLLQLMSSTAATAQR